MQIYSSNKNYVVCIAQNNINYSVVLSIALLVHKMKYKEYSVGIEYGFQANSLIKQLDYKTNENENKTI